MADDDTPVSKPEKSASASPDEPELPGPDGERHGVNGPLPAEPDRTITLLSAYKTAGSKPLYVREPLVKQRPLDERYINYLHNSVHQHFEIAPEEGVQFWLQDKGKNKDEDKWLLTDPTGLEGGQEYTVSWANTSDLLPRQYCPIRTADGKNKQGFAVFDIHGHAIRKGGFICADLDIGLEVGPYSYDNLGQLAQSRVQMSVETDGKNFSILDANPKNEAQMLSILSTKSSVFTAGAGVSAIGPHPVPVVNVSYTRGQQMQLQVNRSSVWSSDLAAEDQNVGKVGWIMWLRDAGYTEPGITAEATHGFNKRFSPVIAFASDKEDLCEDPMVVKLAVFQRCNHVKTTDKKSRVPFISRDKDNVPVKDISEIRSAMDSSEELTYRFTVQICKRKEETACPGTSDLELKLGTVKKPTDGNGKAPDKKEETSKGGNKADDGAKESGAVDVPTADHGGGSPVEETVPPAGEVDPAAGEIDPPSGEIIPPSGDSDQVPSGEAPGTEIAHKKKHFKNLRELLKFSK